MNLSKKSWVYLITGALLFLLISLIAGGWFQYVLWITICGLWLAFGLKSAERAVAPPSEPAEDVTTPELVRFGWLETGTSFLSDEIREKIRQGISSAFLFIDSKMDDLTAWAGGIQGKYTRPQAPAPGPGMPETEGGATPLSAVSSVPRSGPRQGRPLLYGIIGLLLGIPASYWFQAGMLRNKLSLGQYLEYLFNSLGNLDRVSRGSGGDVLTTIIITCVVFAVIGVVAGVWQNRRA